MASLAKSLNREFQNYLAFEKEHTRATLFFSVSPLIKLLHTVWLLLVVNTFLPDPRFWATLSFGLLLISLMVRINFSRLMKFVVILGILYPLIVAIPILFITPGNVWATIPLGEWITSNPNAFTITITNEGIMVAGIYFLRIFTNVTVVAFLILSTPFTHIIHALRQLKVPTVFTSLLMLTYRYFFFFFENLVSIIQADESRHVRKLPFIQRFAHLSNLFGNLLLRSLHQGVNVHRAMLARGYNGEFPLLEFSSNRKATIIYIAIILVYLGLGCFFYFIW